MTPGEIQGSIDEIVEGLEMQRAAMILKSGSDRTEQPFYLHFDASVSNQEMFTITQTVQARFPDWNIHSTRQPPAGP